MLPLRPFISRCCHQIFFEHCVIQREPVGWGCLYYQISVSKIKLHPSLSFQQVSSSLLGLGCERPTTAYLVDLNLDTGLKKMMVRSMHCTELYKVAQKQPMKRRVFEGAGKKLTKEQLFESTQAISGDIFKFYIKRHPLKNA